MLQRWDRISQRLRSAILLERHPIEVDAQLVEEVTRALDHIEFGKHARRVARCETTKPKPPPSFHRGDVLQLSDGGFEIAALVTRATANGRELTLLFHGRVAGWTRIMPVTRGDNHQWRTLDGVPVTLRREAMADSG